MLRLSNSTHVLLPRVFGIWMMAGLLNYGYFTTLIEYGGKKNTGLPPPM